MSEKENPNSIFIREDDPRVKHARLLVAKTFSENKVSMAVGLTALISIVESIKSKGISFDLEPMPKEKN